MPTNSTNSRLSFFEAAWVIARRDFVAVLFSRAFLFFLVGPLFPVLVGGLAEDVPWLPQSCAYRVPRMSLPVAASLEAS